MRNERKARIAQALDILTSLGMPRAQCNERSALCLLALLNLPPGKAWREAGNPLIGITPIMDWIRTHYKKRYAPNTREKVRRQSMHQFVQGGLALYNPDQPQRPVNSPHAVYQVEPACLRLLRAYGTSAYATRLVTYVKSRQSLAARHAMHRDVQRVPLRLDDGCEVKLSPGVHSELISALWDDFGSRFVPGGVLLYAGDTGSKWGHFDRDGLSRLGISVEGHGKMPDVVMYCPRRNWLILAEAVTSHGPVDAKRHEELQLLFSGATAGLVFVSAFPDRKTFARYMGAISWETEVWNADSPTHLIHFNGLRFLGPYDGHGKRGGQ